MQIYAHKKHNNLGAEAYSAYATYFSIHEMGSFGGLFNVFVDASLCDGNVMKIGKGMDMITLIHKRKMYI